MEALIYGGGFGNWETGLDGETAADNGVEGLLRQEGEDEGNGRDHQQAVLRPSPVVLDYGVSTNNRAARVVSFQN